MVDLIISPLWCLFLSRTDVIKDDQFVSRFREKGFKAYELLFDITDSLIHAGIKWDGTTVKFYSLTAKHILGILRDTKFVLPSLKSSDYEERRAAIVCLAFSQKKETYDEIYEIAVGDDLEEVRKTAVWAYLFCKGEKSKELFNLEENRKLAERLENESWNMLWFL